VEYIVGKWKTNIITMIPQRSHDILNNLNYFIGNLHDLMLISMAYLNLYDILHNLYDLIVNLYDLIVNLYEIDRNFYVFHQFGKNDLKY
jgi:hypothetical protein